MKQKLLSFLAVCVLLVGVAHAQTRQVTGRVTSVSDGAPISGVSVSVAGTSTATQTDGAGNYSISAPANSTLVFSYVGFSTERVPVSNQSVVNVQLTDGTEALDEVVVTAMGIRREKRALGYSTQEVGGEDLTQGANSNLATALQGKVAGLEVTPSSGMPGASAKMTIRGSRSFTGNNQPLYVIDGMPISSTPDISTVNSTTGADYSSRSIDIDPNDIESINVLKGQAAAALYGMRASNGVIVITTKSGRGASREQAQITYNTNISFDNVSVLPDFQTTYAQGVGTFNPTTSLSWGPLISELHNDPNFGGNTTNTHTTRDGNQPGKYYVPQRAAAGLDPWVTPQAYNNASAFFNTGNNFNNSLNVAQAFEQGNYSFTLGSTNVNGIVPSTGLDRYNAKLGGELNLSEKWKTGFVGNFMTSKLSKQSGANDGIVATLYGAPPSYDMKGIPSHVEGDPYTQNTFRPITGFDGVYWAVENNEFTEATNRFFGNGYVQYSEKLADNQNLILKYQLGADSYTTNYTDLFGYGSSNRQGEIENFSNSVLEVNSLATATYNWQINESWVFDALIGNELVHRNRRYDYAYGANFNFSGWNHIENASVFSAEQTRRQTRSVGTFGSLSLAYNNMWYLNVTGRNDVVSNMPRNSRSFFYPSVATSFVFTELEGLRDNNVLTFGKLRASFAEVGQAGDYYDSYFARPTYSGGFSSGQPIIYPIGSVVAYAPYGVVYDRNLRPQNTRSYEIGTDLSFYNGLISLDYTFSRQDVKDQIFQVPLAGSSGYSSLVTNGGRIHTNAHEVSLNVAPYRQGDFKWDFTFNFSKIDNYVDELAPGVENIFLGGFVDPQVRAGIGYRFPVIYGVAFARNDADQIIVDDDGFPLPGPERVLGTVAPDFILGFNTRLEYKKVRLAAVLDWKQGGQMYHGTSNVADFYGVTQKSADFRSGDPFLFEHAAVKNTGTDADPIWETNDILIDPNDALDYFDVMSLISEAAIRGTSFVKLREISLGYPVYKTNAFSIDVNAFARNIILWSELKGYDPEVSQGNTNMSGGFERFSLPGTTNYGLGLNLKF